LEIGTDEPIKTTSLNQLKSGSITASGVSSQKTVDQINKFERKTEAQDYAGDKIYL